MRKLIFVLLMLSSMFCNSQVATIDSKKILDSMVGIGEAAMKLENEQQKYEDIYKQKLQQIEIQRGVVQKISNENNDKYKKVAYARLESMERDLQNYQTIMSKKLDVYKDLIYYPYMEKINKAMKEVAERKDIKQVMDIQINAFAYIDPAGDITDEVIEQIKRNQISQQTKEKSSL